VHARCTLCHHASPCMLGHSLRSKSSWERKPLASAPSGDLLKILFLLSPLCPVFVWKFSEVIFPLPRLPCLSLTLCCLLFVQRLPAPRACGSGRCPLGHGLLSICFFFFITNLCALCSTRTRHVFTELGYTGQRFLLTEDSNRHKARM
jgi:hypothetical protein